MRVVYKHSFDFCFVNHVLFAFIQISFNTIYVLLNSVSLLESCRKELESDTPLARGYFITFFFSSDVLYRAYIHMWFSL